MTASADDHDDLFWALRGGGGGNIGVVTSLQMQTFPTGERDVVTMAFPIESAAAVISSWHGWLQSAARDIWGMVNITVGEGAGHCTLITAAPAGTGPAIARLRRRIGHHRQNDFGRS
ncbi:hypothetical protein ACXDF8_21970 [Mycolicibacterium sp. CBM1]